MFAVQESALSLEDLITAIEQMEHFQLIRNS